MITTEVLELVRKFNDLSLSDKKSFVQKVLHSVDDRDMILESMTNIVGIESANTISFMPKTGGRCPACGK